MILGSVVLFRYISLIISMLCFSSAIAGEMSCKHPGKADHSHLEIFLHTDYVPGGDRHAQSPIHRTPDHRRSEVRRSRTHRQRCVPRSRGFLRPRTTTGKRSSAVWKPLISKR